MSIVDLTAIRPLIVLAATSVVTMLTIAVRRNHALTVLLTLVGIATALASLFSVWLSTPVRATNLLIIDRYALCFMGLIFLAAISVAALSYSYFALRAGNHEEFYLLLLFATLGTAVLAASAHFASFFLGIEILSVSLYALAAYLRHTDRGIEAGVKYLILAALSSAFILFGMALVYAETGAMEFGRIASRLSAEGVSGLTLSAGLGLIITGLGFKLAVVPFHLWTPDVYEGAPAPVTAFIASVSKGAVFALLLRFFTRIDIHTHRSLLMIFTLVAVASMFAGNLLALLQKNVKRILAYSSISHLGYLLVTLLAAGSLATSAAAYYLAAYFVTTIGVFGVVTVLSTAERDADNMDDYTGLAWRRPWLAGIFTAMLLSLAGIPLTAGFIGKFYVVAAGVGSRLWIPLLSLVINSVIGLFYYLRIVAALYSRSAPDVHRLPLRSPSGMVVLAMLFVILLWLGLYPAPVIQLIQNMSPSAM